MNLITSRRTLALSRYIGAAIALLFVLVVTPCVFADRLNGVDGKSFHSNNSGSGAYDLDGGSALDKILQSTVDTDLYDPITLATLKHLKEQAQPVINPLDDDPDETRRVAEKALAIQSGRTFIRVIDHSELQPAFRYIKQQFDDVRSFFSFSLQEKEDGYAIAKQHKGRELVRFDVEFNLKQGLNPQLRFGENARIRYDSPSHTPMLEFGWNF